MSTKPLPRTGTKLVTCVDNGGYEASLERQATYVRVPDPQAEQDGLIRVIDESGEDYLYPSDLFAPRADGRPSVPVHASPQTVFVVGPIGDKDAPLASLERRIYEESIQTWEQIILPACEAFGLRPTRADMIASPGEIPDQVFRLLRDSDVVVADLTGANPNVMYELGLRHTTGRLTLQIGERDRLPFDVSVIRTILFKRTEGGLIEARKNLAKALAIGLEDGGDPVSATRIWFESPELSASSELAPREVDDDDEVGFLEKLADLEDGMHGIVPILGNAARITEEITAHFNQSTEETTRSDEQSGGAGARVQIANRLAARLEDPASRLEVVVGEYAQSVRRMDPGMTYLLQRLVDEPEHKAVEFANTIRALIDSAETSLASTSRFRDSLHETGGATRPLKRVTHRIASTLQLFIDVTQILLAWRVLLNRIA